MPSLVRPDLQRLHAFTFVDVELCRFDRAIANFSQKSYQIGTRLLIPNIVADASISHPICLMGQRSSYCDGYDRSHRNREARLQFQCSSLTVPTATTRVIDRASIWTRVCNDCVLSVVSLLSAGLILLQSWFSIVGVRGMSDHNVFDDASTVLGISAFGSIRRSTTWFDVVSFASRGPPILDKGLTHVDVKCLLIREVTMVPEFVAIRITALLLAVLMAPRRHCAKHRAGHRVSADLFTLMRRPENVMGTSS